MNYLENASVIPVKPVSNWDLFSEVAEERNRKERDMAFRHPWFDLAYNYLVAGLLIFLTVALFWWAVDIHYQRRADEQTEAVMASYKADQQAAEDARAHELELAAQSEEAVMDRMAEAMAKLFYGADKFREKYHYSDIDFYTLARCVFNRVENRAYSDDIFKVIDQEDQWVGYYSTNPVLQEYKSLALTSIREWRSETVKPVGNDYLWAEYTPDGIYLKNDFHANGYARRWRYGQ